MAEGSIGRAVNPGGRPLELRRLITAGHEEPDRVPLDDWFDYRGPKVWVGVGSRDRE